MIAFVVVMAVALADAATPSVGLSWLTPQFILALATLVTAVGGVFALFKKTDATKAVVDATNAKVEQVQAQTNGQSAVASARISFLEKELAGVAHRSGSRGATGATGPPGPTSMSVTS